jgi:biotin transport system substrate-specific component
MASATPPTIPEQPVSVSHALPRPLVLADLWASTKVRTLALVVGGAALTAICAQVKFPVPGSPVPITGQTFAVLLAGAALGPARGAASQLVYLLMGLVGMPVYSGRTSGPEILFGATGGYIFGFVLAAAVVGLAARHGWDRTVRRALPLFALGLALVFAFGVAWLAIHTGMSLPAAIDAGLTPYLFGEVLKVAAAAALLPAAWRLVRRLDEH